MEKILVIDDADEIRGMICEVLSLAGYSTCDAEGVKTGIEQAIAHGPDLVLCDVFLGDGNGYQILESLQDHPRLQSVPFIFMSGQAITPEDQRRGMLSGADDYLLKPFKLPELIDTVKARLARARRSAGRAAKELASCYAGSFEALQQRLETLNGRQEAFCLQALGLHRFERFLRLFGWHEADRLVQSLVERLLGQLAGIKPEAYLSHEPHKFYLLWPHAADAQTAASSARHVLESLSRPQPCREHLLHLAAHAGVMLGPSDSPVLRADHALHRAELSGPGSVVFFESGMEQELLLNLTWEQELHLALAEQRFELHYQPQFELGSQRLCGVEALLRLRHPQIGMVPPARFIPVAEECGLMGPIGDWVLASACEQVRQWWREDGVLLKLAVNVSQIQFQQRDFASKVADVLKRTGLTSEALELEITESVMMQDPEGTLDQLTALRGLGVSLAMDDFGTGYSSLATLSRLPFDVLKIDMAFVRGMSHEANTQAIPRAITQMGHSLGLRILAEGIETEGQLRTLQGMGCDLGQGYWYSRPLPAAELPAFWRQRGRHCNLESA